MSLKQIDPRRKFDNGDAKIRQNFFNAKTNRVLNQSVRPLVLVPKKVLKPSLLPITKRNNVERRAIALQQPINHLPSSIPTTSTSTTRDNTESEVEQDFVFSIEDQDPVGGLLTKPGTEFPEWFDANFYFNHYADIKDYFKSFDAVALYEHFRDFGQAEGRYSSQKAFDVFDDQSKQLLLKMKDKEQQELKSMAESGASEQRALIEIISLQVPTVHNELDESNYIRTRPSFPSICLIEPNLQNMESRARSLDFTADGPGPIVLSILLVTYNRIDCTLACLESLHTLKREVKFEVLIWDNNSTDNTIEILDMVKGVSFFKNNENLHFLRAVNQLAPQAVGTYVALINNDTQIAPGSLVAAVNTFRRHPRCAVVGGKIILRKTKMLQEAGSMFLNGHPHGYGRNANPDDFQYNFERPVHYVSGCFYLIRNSIMKALDYFDTKYIPAYFEETDLSVRVLKEGHLIYYQPDCVVYHEEGASSSKQYDPQSLMVKNGVVFRQTHAQFLSLLPASIMEARMYYPMEQCKRILWIESEQPNPQRGSGYPRMASILAWLVRHGWHITYHSIWGKTSSCEELPYGVELVTKAEMPLAALLASRPNYYGVAIISRIPTFEAYRHMLSNGKLAGIPTIYDLETLAGLRELEKLKYYSNTSQQNAERMLASDVDFCSSVKGAIVVSKSEIAYLQSRGVNNCFQLGHIMNVDDQFPDKKFEHRNGFLFMGFGDFVGSPNIDSMDWFCDFVFPIIQKSLPDAEITIAGKMSSDLIAKHKHKKGVKFLGMLSTIKLQEILGEHRVFVAPTRFASGLPHKCHQAAASGLPMVCTTLLASQLDWDDNVVLSAPCNANLFAQACVRLYQDRQLWEKLQYNALQSVRADCSVDQLVLFADWLSKLAQ